MFQVSGVLIFTSVLLVVIYLFILPKRIRNLLSNFGH